MTGEAQWPIGSQTTGRGIAPPPLDAARQLVIVAGARQMGAFNGGQQPGLRCRGACVETQAGNASEGWEEGSRDRRPYARYGRPEARYRTLPDDRPTSRAVGTFNVRSNAAVNSDLSCFL